MIAGSARTKKTVVEDCQDLDLTWLARQGFFVAGHSGAIQWNAGEWWDQTDKTVDSIACHTIPLARYYPGTINNHLNPKR